MNFKKILGNRKTKTIKIKSKEFYWSSKVISKVKTKLEGLGSRIVLRILVAVTVHNRGAILESHSLMLDCLDVYFILIQNF